MNCKLLVVLLFVVASCANSPEGNGGPPSTVDSALVHPIPDAAPPPDTDDHNRPSGENVTLDSAIGPHTVRDTARRNQQ